MAGNTILKINQIRLDEVRIKLENDEDFNQKQKTYIKKYGQFITPIICKVDGVFRVVDGLGFILNYQQLGFEEINCFLISDKNININHFLTFRLFQNIKKTKLHHLSIAEIVSSYFKSKRDIRQLSISTNIVEADLEKYQNLLEFNWDEFARKPLSELGEPTNFFEMLEQGGEIF